MKRHPPWRVQVQRVCSSTEMELERWLERVPENPPRLERPWAVVAHRQRFGHGQHGRIWHSPPGGVWLSAALPWAPALPEAAAPGLAVAVGLLRQLDDLGLEARLKWPNDILLRGRDGEWRKLAGLLSGLRLRGALVRWVRVGLGLNGHNPVPRGGTNLVGALGRARARPRQLLPRVLAALDWAMARASEAERVRREAESRLWLPSSQVRLRGQWWQVRGLTQEGGLAVIASDGRPSVLHRTWPEMEWIPYIGVTQSGLADTCPHP